MHAYIHTYIHTHSHTYIHTYIHPCMHAYIHPCIHASMHPCIHASMHPHACMHACMHPSIHPSIHTSCYHSHYHINMHRHTHLHPTHTHTHIYIYILVGGLEHLFFSIYWGCHHPNWLIFFRGVETTNQTYIYIFIHINYYMFGAIIHSHPFLQLPGIAAGHTSFRLVGVKDPPWHRVPWVQWPGAEHGDFSMV